MGQIIYWDDFLNYSKELKTAVQLVNKIMTIGTHDDKEVVLVGGLVRDIIIAIDKYVNSSDGAEIIKNRMSFYEYLKDIDFEINDVDLATNIPISELESHFECIDVGKNKDFGILVVKYGGYTFEVANFRQESGYTDGRHPDSVAMIKDFKGDAERRDFTINAMGLTVDGDVYDYFNGYGDIIVECIETVGDPDSRFSEDYLRMLRAIRFATKLKFSIGGDTYNAIVKNAHKITEISWERILKELNKMASLTGEQFARGVEWLDSTGLLQHILPEVVMMKGLKQNPKFHPEGDVYEHTMSALKSNKIEDKLINWSILLHDVGKLVTHTVDETGDHYYKHHLESDGLIDSIASRLKMDNDTCHAIKFAALNHMTMHDFMKIKQSVAMRLIEDKNWYVLFNVGVCDSMARGDLYNPEEYINNLRRVGELKERFKEKQAIDKIRKVVNGNFVMEVRPDIKPSPEMGRIIKTTVEWIIDNNIDITDIDGIKEFVRIC